MGQGTLPGDVRETDANSPGPGGNVSGPRRSSCGSGIEQSWHGSIPEQNRCGVGPRQTRPGSDIE